MTASPAVEAARRRQGRVGAGLAAPDLQVGRWRGELARVERLGYGSVWTNEPPPPVSTRDVFAQLAVMLAATSRIVVGSAIASIWARHPAMTQGGAELLAAAYPGRVVLGTGVSMRPLVEQSGQDFGQPLAKMRAYLDGMDVAAAAPQPQAAFPRVLAALGPRMLELAAERADGAHPAVMPVEHTTLARRLLGPDKLLIVGLAAILDPDRVRAREAARRSRVGRMPGSPYVRAYRRLGYTEEDLAGGGSDRLLDAVFALGDEAAIAKRVQEHLDAGADHVIVHPVTDRAAMVEHLERLAPALVG